MNGEAGQADENSQARSVHDRPGAFRHLDQPRAENPTAAPDSPPNSEEAIHCAATEVKIRSSLMP